jgi:hypothetical protein
MQINHDLDIVIPCPSNDSVEVFSLTLDIWLAAGDIVRPETDRYSNMIQTGRYDVLGWLSKDGKKMKRTSNLSNVIFLNPCLPVVHQSVPSGVVVLVLAKRPLVDDSLITGVLKEGGSYLSAQTILTCKWTH